MRHRSRCAGAIGRGEVLMEFKEGEGATLVLALADAQKHAAAGLTWEYEAAWLTLTVHSSLEAIGLTGAFATALATDKISANVVAGFYHDHIFVASSDGERAMTCLRQLAARNEGGEETPALAGAASIAVLVQQTIREEMSEVRAKLLDIEAKLPTSAAAAATVDFLTRSLSAGSPSPSPVKHSSVSTLAGAAWPPSPPQQTSDAHSVTEMVRSASRCPLPAARCPSPLESAAPVD